MQRHTFLGVILLLSVSAFAQGLGGLAGMGGKAGAGGGAIGGGGGFFYTGYGCTDATSNTCTVGLSTGGNVVGLVVGNTFTTGSHVGGYTVVALGIYFTTKDGTNPHYQMAIYDTSAGAPAGTPLCNSAANNTVGTVPGWQEPTDCAGQALSASHTYFIAWQADGASTRNVQDTTAATLYFYNNVACSSSYGSWCAGNTFGSAGTVSASLYVKQTEN